MSSTISEVASRTPASAMTLLILHSSTRSSPGESAWGAIAIITSSRSTGVRNEATKVTTDHVEVSGKCGILTENTASYMALIGGLRATLRHLREISIPSSSTTVTAATTSSTVLLQMSSRFRVRDSHLSLYYAVSKGLSQRFRSVTFIEIDDGLGDSARLSSENVATISCQALESPLNPLSSIKYSPCRSGLVEATVMGVPTRASHDLGVADVNPHMLIDARFLRKLPHLGSIALRNVADPHPVGVAICRPNMTVLGLIFIQLGILWPMSNGERSEVTHWVWAYVIDWLPVPLHVSVMDPKTPFFSIEGIVFAKDLVSIPFESTAVPSSNAHHPFWLKLQAN